MKKTLAMLLSLMMVIGLFAGVTAVADSAEPTVMPRMVAPEAFAPSPVRLMTSHASARPRTSLHSASMI